MQTIRAIKIDVVNRTVFGIEMPTTLSGIYTAVNCSVFEQTYLDANHCILVDEEGAMNGGNQLFSIDDRIMLFGNGVIVALDKQSENYACCTLDLEAVKRRIKFHIAIPVE